MDEKFIVLEIQTSADGKVSTLTNSYDDINSAYNKYYTILASASVSTVARHTAVLMSNTGFAYEYKYFDHVILEEETQE